MSSDTHLTRTDTTHTAHMRLHESPPPPPPPPAPPAIPAPRSPALPQMLDLYAQQGELRSPPSPAHGPSIRKMQQRASLLCLAAALVVVAIDGLHLSKNHTAFPPRGQKRHREGRRPVESSASCSYEEGSCPPSSFCNYDQKGFCEACPQANSMTMLQWS